MSQKSVVDVPDMYQVGLAAGSASDYRPKWTGNSYNTSLTVEDMRRRRSRPWGDTAAMLSEPCRAYGGAKNRKHRVTFKETYIRCQSLRSIKLILIITYTINIISPQPLPLPNTSN